VGLQLGVLVNFGSTGAWRYTERIVDGLLANDFADGVSLFVTTHHVNESVGLAQRWGTRARVVQLESPRVYTSVRWARLLQKKLEKKLRCRLPEDRNRAKLEQCDLLFCPWPYNIAAPVVDRPLVFIPHDFTYARNFGTTLYGSKVSDMEWQMELHRGWFNRGTCVLSSAFVRDEVRRLFGCGVDPAVIPLARLSGIGRLPEADADARVRNLGVSGRFVLCANNLAHHKNFGQLCGAFHLLRQKHPDVCLVSVGASADAVCGAADIPFGIGLSRPAADSAVLGLGLVSDEDLIALMQRSRVLVNPSLSEANNGPGLDAWDIGCPVAMSRIPPFLEHLEFLGVRAQLFEPRCVFEIRDAIDRVLSDPVAALADAAVSRGQMRQWTWREVSQRYADLFRRLLKAG
jgi:glycosyltransferase involved in cell wall biosynthesis